MKVSNGKIKLNSTLRGIINSKSSHKITFPLLELEGSQSYLYDDLMPQTIKSSPISSLSKDDNLWIATSMLSRISNISSKIVVMEKEFPVGTIGCNEIIKGILKNPSQDFFEKTLTKHVMNRKFYLDTRKVTLSKIIQQVSQSDDIFAIIQNSKYDFSAISTKEILEIGTFAKSEINAGYNNNKKIIVFNREDKIKEILKLLSNDVEYLVLQDESLILDRFSIINKIAADLEFLENVDDFLDLNASIFEYYAPKLIPQKLSLSEICKIMLSMDNPYCITKNRIWSPHDILEILQEGLT